MCKCLGKNQLHVLGTTLLLVLLATIITKKRQLRHVYWLMTLPHRVWCHNVKEGPFTTGFIHLQVWGVVEERPFNVNLFCFHNDMFNNFLTNNISLNLSNFRSTNIEVARIIISAFKSSMDILLFQWSWVSKYPEYKP